MYEFAENGEKIDDQHDTAISYNVLFPVNINKKHNYNDHKRMDIFESYKTCMYNLAP